MLVYNIPKMTSITEHKRKIKEHLEEIADAIDLGIEKRPVTIGFHCSLCACELLELYLHKIGAISSGKIVKHSWFKRPLPGQKLKPLIERKLPVSFPGKEDLYELLYSLEENRSALVYGKTPKTQVEVTLRIFNAIKKQLLKKLTEEGVEF